MKLCCPVCTQPAIETKTGNGGSELYVGEDDECYDPDIKMYRCVNPDCGTTFYLSIASA